MLKLKLGSLLLICSLMFTSSMCERDEVEPNDPASTSTDYPDTNWIITNQDDTTWFVTDENDSTWIEEEDSTTIYTEEPVTDDSTYIWLDQDSSFYPGMEIPE